MISLVLWLAGTLIVVLAPVILIHELGHFTLAKLAGVRVEEFGLGYPPRLLKLWRGRGHLEVEGTRVMIPAAFDLPPSLYPGAQVEVNAYREGDGPCILERLSKADGERPGDVEHSPEDGHTCLRGRLTELEPGTVYSLNLLPMGAFVKMTGEEDPTDPMSLAARPKRWRVAVLAAGAAFNLLAAFIIMSAAYASGLPQDWLVRVASVEARTAAEEAGLQSGDIIVAVDGTRIQDGMAQLRSIIVAAPDQPIALTVLRGDGDLALQATPHRDADDQGYLGIMMEQWPDRESLLRYSLPDALGAGVRDIVTVVVMTIRIPALLAEGTVTPSDVRPTSMVGITGVLTYSLQQSINWKLPFPVLQTTALISLALGLTNLLPLPALDGGRIAFIVLEALRGRRVSPEREAAVHVVGLAILVGLMVLMMFYDVVNPIIPWSWLR